ncbi:hypothetical protein [Mucilaginibacter pedocola]|uniref:DUF4386 domain-containing protein n=1 Tax=Mucilaginibacter pedocola TaxID=1792845 RepID=A0A1S9PD78_9SPHI|nr:hypothetical protein [Mucilaginibacter pedocola]OOQ58817.1 hypothetical protein BC343_09225 [Mucilaginibacter pedocola]
MKPKRLIIELIVLAIIYTAVFFCYSVVYAQIYNSPDIANVYKTYSITPPSPPQILVFSTFCLISTVVYFIRSVVNRYKSNIVNVVLLVGNVFSVTALLGGYQAVIELEKAFI